MIVEIKFLAVFKTNVLDKTDDQRELAHFGMAKKRGFEENNVFDKPDDQRKLVHFGMARKRPHEVKRFR